MLFLRQLATLFTRNRPLVFITTMSQFVTIGHDFEAAQTFKLETYFSTIWLLKFETVKNLNHKGMSLCEFHILSLALRTLI